MRNKVLPIPFFALSFLFASSALAVAHDLASMDWSVKAPHNLAANPPADDVIKAFMGKVDGADGYPLGICYARFADLQHSSTLSLVVPESDGRFCHLFVVDKTAGGFRSYSLDLALGVDGPEIKDLSRNRNLELIVPTDLTGYQGGGYCGAQWPVIYAWTGSTYSDVSSHYKGYYEKQLVSLKKEIAAAQAQKEHERQGSAARRVPSAEADVGVPNVELSADANSPSVQAATEYGPDGSVARFGAILMKPAPQALPLATPEPDRRGLNCTKVKAAKIERFLGVSRDAGISDAIKWADSNDPDDREFAAWVFADIATPEAIRDLQTLSHDSGTASTAKILLEQAKKGPVVHTVEEDSICPGRRHTEPMIG
jgi:hypothetical protein